MESKYSLSEITVVYPASFLQEAATIVMLFAEDVHAASWLASV
jgi:hypothetical protein